MIRISEYHSSDSESESDFLSDSKSYLNESIRFLSDQNSGSDAVGFVFLFLFVFIFLLLTFISIVHAAVLYFKIREKQLQTQIENLGIQNQNQKSDISKEEDSNSSGTNTGIKTLLGLFYYITFWTVFLHILGFFTVCPGYYVYFIQGWPYYGYPESSSSTSNTDADTNRLSSLSESSDSDSDAITVVNSNTKSTQQSNQNPVVLNGFSWMNYSKMDIAFTGCVMTIIFIIARVVGEAAINVGWEIEKFLRQTILPEEEIRNYEKEWKEYQEHQEQLQGNGKNKEYQASTDTDSTLAMSNQQPETIGNTHSNYNIGTVTVTSNSNSNSNLINESENYQTQQYQPNLPNTTNDPNIVIHTGIPTGVNAKLQQYPCTPSSSSTAVSNTITAGTTVVRGKPVTASDNDINIDSYTLPDFNINLEVPSTDEQTVNVVGTEIRTPGQFTRQTQNQTVNGGQTETNITRTVLNNQNLNSSEINNLNERSNSNCNIIPTPSLPHLCLTSSTLLSYINSLPLFTKFAFRWFANIRYGLLLDVTMISSMMTPFPYFAIAFMQSMSTCLVHVEKATESSESDSDVCTHFYCHPCLWSLIVMTLCCYGHQKIHRYCIDCKHVREKIEGQMSECGKWMLFGGNHQQSENNDINNDSNATVVLDNSNPGSNRKVIAVNTPYSSKFNTNKESDVSQSDSTQCPKSQSQTSNSSIKAGSKFSSDAATFSGGSGSGCREGTTISMYKLSPSASAAAAGKHIIVQEYEDERRWR